MLIHFNKLYISDDRKHLIVKVKVGEEYYYNNVYISGINIQDKDTYGTGHVYNEMFEDSPMKEIEFKIPLSSILSDIKNNILFINIRISGTPTLECPCGQDEIPTAVFVDTSAIVNSIKSSSLELSKKCEKPKFLTNYLLTYKALEYAIRTKDYNNAIKFLKKLTDNTSINSYKCGCNG